MDRAGRTLLTFLLLASSTPPSPAAASAGGAATEPLSEEIEVRLVEVETVVTDRDGWPVDGLEAGDFELLADGEPVAITHFEAPGEAATARTEEERLQLAVYVDRRYLQPGDLRDLVEPLGRFLRRHQDVRVLLAVGDRHLEILQGFTTVPELVTTRLAELPATSTGSALFTEHRRLLREVQRTKALVSTGSQAVDRNSRPRALLAEIEAFAAEVERDVQGSADSLTRLAAALAGVPGRKAILYVGGRLPAGLPRELDDAWRSAFGSGSDHSLPIQPGAGGGDAGVDMPDGLAGSAALDAGRPFRDVAAVAAASGVTLHVLDAGALRRSVSAFASGDPAGGRGPGDAGGPQLAGGPGLDRGRTLTDLAAETGGLALTGNRGFEAFLDHLRAALAGGYTLGFSGGGDDGEPRRIEVRLRAPGPGWRVHHRRSYRPRSPDREAAERATSALLLEDAADPLHNPLDVVLTVGPPSPAAGGGRRVPVAVTLPLERLALVPDGRVHAGRLSIFFSAGGFENGTAPVTKAVVPVRIRNSELLTALGRRVEYKTELELPSAATGRVAVTVRDDFRPLSATALAPLGGLSEP